MGEVFRADDLKLQQPVALKFLPEGLDKNPERLERLFAEVRLARQISHSAVCRVFDIGEANGRHFLTMEYVDGENLGSLLRRVGRVPKERAIEMARQICAGLAAAHEKGIVHRDLKPQNVLVDGKGQVRIVDFGLAGVAEAIRGDDVRSGTPAYMAPEQLGGKEVTTRSDIYSLGLVLYELFTGRRAIKGKTLAEVKRAQEEWLIETPSQIVSDMDPAAERAILRCLEKDPAMRPPSALAVSAALPGGDPVAAALAAGETPSPEMIAALGRGDLMPPWLTWCCVAVILLTLVAMPRLSPAGRLSSLIPLPKSPEVLADRAQELLKHLNPAGQAVDHAAGFRPDFDYLRDRFAKKVGLHVWQKLSAGDPPVLLYWYRAGDRPLVADNPFGIVMSVDPPRTTPGTSSVVLDPSGRLLDFLVVPPEREDSHASTTATVDWSALFAEARLDPAAFQSVEPRWVPPVFADARVAWEGRYTGSPEDRLRVEAASYRGRPIWFSLIGDWVKPSAQRTPFSTVNQRRSLAIFLTLICVFLVGGIVLARRNLQLGRSDKKGAARLSAYVFILAFLAWLISAHHVGSPNDQAFLTFMGIALAVCYGAIIATLYLAIEPYARRLWPRVLVSWSRLVAGGYSDPLVGQDILIGTAAGAVIALSVWLSASFAINLGGTPPPPVAVWLNTLLGPHRVAEKVIDQHLLAVFGGCFVLLEIVIFRLLLRRQWLAAVAFVAIFAVPRALGSDLPTLAGLGLFLLLGVGLWFLVLKFGFVAAIVAFTIGDVWLQVPWVRHLSGWSATPTIWVTAFVLIVAAYGFWASRHGRPVTAM